MCFFFLKILEGVYIETGLEKDKILNTTENEIFDSLQALNSQKR